MCVSKWAPTGRGIETEDATKSALVIDVSSRGAFHQQPS